MNIDKFKKLPIMGILRGCEESSILPLTQAIMAAGLETIEITMNTPAAPRLIQQMVAASNGQLMVGAGTVLSLDQMHQALDAGASFIVSPHLVEPVVRYCVQQKIPVFPGALTPTEIYQAWEAGATMVKVFPAQVFGPSYFKAVKGPFDKVELLACGGVNVETVAAFFQSGASAIAFGASIFKSEWLKQGRFDLITEDILRLIQASQL